MLHFFGASEEIIGAIRKFARSTYGVSFAHLVEMIHFCKIRDFVRPILVNRCIHIDVVVQYETECCDVKAGIAAKVVVDGCSLHVKARAWN